MKQRWHVENQIIFSARSQACTGVHSRFLKWVLSPFARAYKKCKPKVKNFFALIILLSSELLKKLRHCVATYRVPQRSQQLTSGSLQIISFSSDVNTRSMHDSLLEHCRNNDTLDPLIDLTRGPLLYTYTHVLSFKVMRLATETNLYSEHEWTTFETCRENNHIEDRLKRTANNATRCNTTRRETRRRTRLISGIAHIGWMYYGWRARSRHEQRKGIIIYCEPAAAGPWHAMGEKWDSSDGRQAAFEYN
jgi:hypothetical protein